MNTITLTRPCPFCHTVQSITINFDEYEEGMAVLSDGATIQNAFPRRTPDEREFIKTGICTTCWEKMMSSELGD